MHTWTAVGDYTVTFTAFNTDHPEGVSTRLTLSVVPLISPSISIGSWSNNTFTLSFPSQAGVSYRVERTASLAPPVVWQTVTILFSSGGEESQITDSTATDAIRFYRVRVL